MSKFDFSVQFRQYTDSVGDLARNIKSSQLISWERFLHRTINSKGRLFVIGNGGSGTISEHLALDWGAGSRARNLRSIKCISLNTDSAAVTAIGNDFGFDRVFEAQIANLATGDDSLLALSCSGNSSNLVKAVKFAKTLDMDTFAWVGFKASALEEVLGEDEVLSLSADQGAYEKTEDIFAMIAHFSTIVLRQSIQ